MEQKNKNLTVRPPVVVVVGHIDHGKSTLLDYIRKTTTTEKEAGGIIEFEETIARALKDVKICDPAIGSGAFPMGLLNEIFQLVHVCPLLQYLGPQPQSARLLTGYSRWMCKEH
jgi:ABC-type phosphate/phosphonate transport system ATPase subunit